MVIRKGQKSLFRYYGILESIFSCVQAIVWIPLIITGGILCYYLGCGESSSQCKYSRTFYDLYFHRNKEFKYPNFIAPITFHFCMWLLLIITTVWLAVSIYLIRVFKEWEDAEKIKKASTLWTRVSLAVCIFDLIMFCLFTAEFHLLNNSKEDIVLCKSVIKLKPVIESANENDPSNEDFDERLYPFDTRDKFGNPFIEATTKKPGRSTVPVRTTLPRGDGHTQNPTDNMETGDDRMLKIARGVRYNHLASPPAVMMTFAIRGFVLWVHNIIAAFMLQHFCNQREGQPTLLLRLNK